MQLEEKHSEREGKTELLPFHLHREVNQKKKETLFFFCLSFFCFLVDVLFFLFFGPINMFFF